MGGIAIVTGASRGIGAATACALAANGWRVAISYRSDRDGADAVAAAAGDALVVQADVAVEADVVHLFAAVDDRLGPVAGLVNNAGIVGARARVDELSGERIERIMAVNVVGALLCAREAVKRMSTRHGGRGGVIVNVSSAASRIGSPGEYVDYAASKGAIDTMTLGLAKEVADEGIRVNAVRPGIIDTDIHASGGQPDRVERLGPTVPMGRAGRPDEVGSAIAWLCSDAASYVSGSILDVSGGR